MEMQGLGEDAPQPKLQPASKADLEVVFGSSGYGSIPTDATPITSGTLADSSKFSRWAKIGKYKHAYMYVCMSCIALQ